LLKKSLGTFAIVAVLAPSGCSNSDTGSFSAAGGVSGSRATTDSGGNPSTGGVGFSTVSGQIGGTAASGGSPSIGGSTQTSPLAGVGGRPPVGGTTSGGGTTQTFATTANGGRLSFGGTTSTGGVVTTGGTTSTGGMVATGGTKAAGGTSTAVGTSSGGSTTTTTTTSTVKTCAIATTLKAAGDCNNKLIGTALAQGQLNNGTYTTAAKEHNFVTPENEMKWDTVEASRGNFNYAPGNAIVNFANQNGMKVKGHTLVWHSQLPSWVSSLSTASDVRTVMLNHINSVMGNYKGKIYAWDVVNEAWDTPSKKGDGTATLRTSVFMNKLGKGFIDEAFTAARAADPNALLIYNDYSTEGMNDKSNAVYEMVKSMKERGIPIDGVGIQTHIGTPNDTPTAAEIKQNIDRIAALGLQIMISEMDVNGCDGYTADSMAKLYHDIVAACVSQPKCTAITFWGISDANSWLNSFSEAGCNGKSPSPLLWDNSYKKKATYTSVVQALTGN